MKYPQRHGFQLRHTAIATQAPALGVFVLVCSLAVTAAAQNPDASYMRLVFSAEGRPLATSGCLSVLEHKYPNTPWWSQSVSSVQNEGAERALRTVIAAFLAKDREALIQISDPSSREGASFERQAGAFFEQFSVLTLKAIPRSDRIDDLTVFFLTVDFHGKTSEAPLVFKEDAQGKFWFLPSPPQSIEFAIAKDWIREADRSSSDVLGCSKERVDRANLRLPLTATARPESKDQSYLYLTGSSIVGGAEQAEDTKRVLLAFNKLKQALTAYQGVAPLPELDSLGAQRLQEWWSTADASERTKYVSAVVNEQPFFVFDLNPLFVLFTRSGVDQPHVLYFTPDSKGGLLWTNSSYGSTFDRIFKTGPLYESAAPDHPFSAWLRPKAGADGAMRLGFERHSDVRLAKDRTEGEVLEGCCK